DQRRTWCEWFSCLGQGAHPSTGVPVAPNGYTEDRICFLDTELYANASISDGALLSIDQCETNLALSHCDATLEDLADCVLSTKRNRPTPLGCGPYLGTTGCSGTIVNAYPLDHDAGVFPTGQNYCALRVR